jgi:hypothetical protein
VARYRTVRTDFHTHERTRGLSPLARDLMMQGVLANIAGLLERSVRKMATTAGDGVTPRAVEAAIVSLTERGIARWWPDLEILWIVEAADEQSTNAKAWKGAESLVKDAPPEVRAAFVDRYRERVSHTLSDSLSATLFHQEQEQKKEQEQEQGGSSPTAATVDAPRRATKLAPCTEAC